VKASSDSPVVLTKTSFIHYSYSSVDRKSWPKSRRTYFIRLAGLAKSVVDRSDAAISTSDSNRQSSRIQEPFMIYDFHEKSLVVKAPACEERAPVASQPLAPPAVTPESSEKE
jgi:hypothetical protein